MDRSREFDLDELSEALQNAKSPGEREYYERIIYRILNESDDIKYWREQLLRATRVKDKRRIQYVIREIHMTRLSETSGASWGSNKLERTIN